MPKFVLRVMTPCSGDVEFESGLWATTREEAMVERVVFTDAEEKDEGRALQEGEVRRVYRAWEVSADR